jgi:hypothetical protein
VKEIWKYLPSPRSKRRVKHYFFKYFTPTAVCGISPVWYLPAHACWRDDKEGLAEREECKKCVGIKANYEIKDVPQQPAPAPTHQQPAVRTVEP